MSNLIIFFLTIFAGITASIQPSVNGRLAQKIGILESSLVSFVVGSLALLIIVLGSGPGNMKGLVHANWWELSGGLFGAFFVCSTIIAVPKIGTGATMAALILSQLITGIILDHFGLFGFSRISIDIKRLVGVLFLIIGAIMIVKT
jgi:bacterial/archaeal transporter family-2 protein